MAKNMPESWEPPYRAYSADIGSDTVTVAVVGTQAPTRADAHRGLARILPHLAGVPGLLSHEECDVLMQVDVHHAVAVTYWSSRAAHDEWWGSEEVQTLADSFLVGETGMFCETFTSPRDHLEANSSTPDADWGIGRSHTWYEDPRIGYWGASRDRIEAAEDGALTSDVSTVPPLGDLGGAGRRVTVRPPANVCFIRTVQGWSGASREQRDFFLRGPYRAYLAGVRDLQANPRETACLSARLLKQPTGSPRRPVRETQAWFLSLGDMEQWVWHSPTHGRIMETFGRFAERFGVDISLLLSHEVYVVPEGGALMTYVNCAHSTGFLGADAAWGAAEPAEGPRAAGAVEVPA